MKQVEIEASRRNETGKGVARKLRRSGQIPGVIYGSKTEPIPLAVNMHEFNRLLFLAKGEQMLITMNIKDNGNSIQKLAMIKDLQLHPVNDQVRHIDFYEIFMDEPVTVEVPIAAKGKAKGVDEGGTMEFLQRTIEVSCLPMAIPKAIEVDVSDLGIGDALHVADLTPPEGVTIVEDPETTIITVVGAAPTEAEELEAAEEEAEAAAEAAAEAKEKSSEEEAG